MRLVQKIVLAVLATLVFIFLAAYLFGFANMLIFFINFITAID